MASKWGIVIKRALGRAGFGSLIQGVKCNLLLAHPYAELPMEAEHVLAVEMLPMLHKDPFDRLLMAQARTEGISLLTTDASICRYGESVLKV